MKANLSYGSPLPTLPHPTSRPTPLGKANKNNIVLIKKKRIKAHLNFTEFASFAVPAINLIKKLFNFVFTFFA